MSTRRFSRLRLATALGPLLVVSAAWTASGSGPQPHSGPEVKDEATSPTNSQRTLPQAPLGKPASVTAPAAASQPAVNHTRRAATGSVSATGIPAAALAAYQRAATIIDDADPACHLDWPLLAGIGRVESDHGRTGGSRLTASGVASPAILGPTLTGKRHTSRILDTDRGRYDGDTRFDRALGPLQFLPSTWAIVGVDADGDGKRNPQDINDAALAAAVFLCSGSDLSDPAAQRAAVLRYNHSPSYAATVLRVAAAYRAGGVPAGTVTVQQIAALPPDTTDSARLPSPHQRGEHGKHDGRGHDGAQHHAHHQAHHQGSGVAAAAPQHPAQHAVADTGQGTGASGTSKGGAAPLRGSDAGDTTAPAAPTIASLNSPTNDATPTISGTGEPKATVSVTIAGATLTATASSKGAWSVTPGADLDDGDYTITATAQDATGNTSQASTAQITVDTKAPDAPSITSTPAVGGTQISGTGEAGATVTVLVDGEPDGTATVDDKGNWTVTVGTALTGAEKITATQTDAAGNTSPASAPVTVPAADDEEKTPSDAASPSGSPSPTS